MRLRHTGLCQNHHADCVLVVFALLDARWKWLSRASFLLMRLVSIT